MNFVPVSIRFRPGEKEVAMKLAEERGMSISDLIRSLIMQEQREDLLKQILMNTAVLRCGFSAHMTAEEKTKTAELWATEKVKLGVE